MKEVLLEIGSSKNVVRFESDPTVRDKALIKQKIRGLVERSQYLQTFCRPDMLFLLQIYSKDYDCYVDVEDTDDIPNKSKLLVIIPEKENSEGVGSSPSGQAQDGMSKEQPQAAMTKQQPKVAMIRQPQQAGMHWQQEQQAGMPRQQQSGMPSQQSQDGMNWEPSQAGMQADNSVSSIQAMAINALLAEREAQARRSQQGFGTNMGPPSNLDDFGRRPFYEHPQPEFGRNFDMRNERQFPVGDDRSFGDRGRWGHGPPSPRFDDFEYGRHQNNGGPHGEFGRFDNFGPPGQGFGGPNFNTGPPEFDRKGKGKKNNWTWYEIMDWEADHLGFRFRERPYIRKIYETGKERIWDKQPVQLLNECCQQEGWPFPEFQTTVDGTTDKEANFKFKVKVNDQWYHADRHSMNKRQAKVYAAIKALYECRLI